jgi:hypothetical protein
MYYCAQDIVEYLMNSVGGGAQDGEHRLLRAAAHHGYRDVVHARDWTWHATAASLPSPVANTDNKAFLLPAGVKTIDELVPPDRSTRTAFVTPQEYVRLETHTGSHGGTIFWTLTQDATRPDRMRLMIAGTPSSIVAGRQYFYTYRRRPPPLRFMGFEKVCRDGSLTAQNAAGTVKRYGTATQFPEGPAGIHPYTAEEILGRTGSLAGTPPANAKTVVSDALDISEGMFSAVLSGAEAWLARLQGKNVEGAMAVHARDLRLAMESDVVAPMSGRRSLESRYPEDITIPYAGIATGPRSLGFYSPSAPDTGT